VSGVDELETRALDFVGAAGADIDRARAAVTLGVEDGERLMAMIGAVQGPEGGFAFPEVAAGDPLAGALHALSILNSAGLRGSAPAERVVFWLGRSRRDDGSWSLVGGGGHVDHLATGYVAGFLAQSPFARAIVLHEVGDWLSERWSPDLVRGGDFAMIAAYAHFFANSPHDAADSILQWCGRELERGVRSGGIPALFALRVFSLCEAPVFPGTRLKVGALLERLVEEQAPDGGWLPGLPPDWRVAASLGALDAWRRFGGGRAFAGGRSARQGSPFPPTRRTQC
jgi:hypothetical protein